MRVAGKLLVDVLAGWPGFDERQLEDLGVDGSASGARSLAPLGRLYPRGEGYRRTRTVDTFLGLPTMNDITAAFE